MRDWFVRLAPFAKGFAGAVLGIVIVLLLVHAWVDHLALHNIADFVNHAAPKIQKLP